MNVSFAILGSIFMFASIATTAIFLGPAWDEFTTRFIRDLRPRLQALGIPEDSILSMMRLWGLGLVAILFVGGILLGKTILAFGVFMLVNAAGINIGSGAVLNASGVILSTRDISNTDFLFAFRRI